MSWKCSDCGTEAKWHPAHGYYCPKCGLLKPNQKYPYGIEG